MPPISNHANLPDASFGVLKAALEPLRRLADVMNFADSQSPRFAFTEGDPDDSGNVTLLLTRPSSELAFRFVVTSLRPDGEILSAEIWQGTPLS